MLTATHSPTWVQAEADAPAPRSTLVWSPSLERQRAIIDAIDETVLARALGRGKDFDELFEAYSRSLPVFSHLLHALDELLARTESSRPQSPEALDEELEEIAEQWAPVVPEHIDMTRLLQLALRDARRGNKVVERLEARGWFDDFLASESGRRWVSASAGLAWGTFGIEMIAHEPDDYSTEDIYFCLSLIKFGPRDSFAFLRGYELDRLDVDAGAPDESFEVGSLPDELRALEAEEFEHAERLLAAIESDSEKDGEEQP